MPDPGTASLHDYFASIGRQFSIEAGYDVLPDLLRTATADDGPLPYMTRIEDLRGGLREAFPAHLRAS